MALVFWAPRELPFRASHCAFNQGFAKDEKCVDFVPRYSIQLYAHIQDTVAESSPAQLVNQKAEVEC